jgi:death-on-curing protein
VIYLTLPELLHVAGRVLGPEVAVRDYGLLEAALTRPQATAFGKDAYPSLDAKEAALLHSLARNHALIDGNKRLGLAAVIAFYGLNGHRLTLTNYQAYDLVMKVAAGELDQVEQIAAVLQGATAPRHQDVRTSTRKPRVRLDRCSAATSASLRSGPRKVPIVLTLERAAHRVPGQPGEHRGQPGTAGLRVEQVGHRGQYGGHQRVVPGQFR